jgi:hypothetical protein
MLTEPVSFMSVRIHRSFESATAHMNFLRGAWFSACLIGYYESYEDMNTHGAAFVSFRKTGGCRLIY